MNNHTTLPDSDLARALAAGAPLVYVATWEEERLASMLESISHALFGDTRPIWEWSAARGFSDGPGKDLRLHDPVDALAFLVDSNENALYLMKDLPALYEDNPVILRALREAYDAFASRTGKLVLSYPHIQIPPALEREVILLELSLPDINERLKQLLVLNREYHKDQRLADTWLKHISNAMQGITLNQTRDLLRKIISLNQQRPEPFSLDQILDLIQQARSQVLMKENCLEVISDRIDVEQLGGLSNLKNWMLSRRRLFSEEAKAAGIRPPSGILIMGVSGCGKSLAAKIIPSVWQLPLIRLDMNLIMSGGWGTPEVAWERARRAIENAAPVVLWIDELENSFGFINNTVTSGNMTIFSSFLTWMQEKPENVFVAATANNIEMLPPEMIRKGRFDQLFFVDLPDKKARIEILRIHFLKLGINPYQFDIDSLATKVHEWSAAEIEQMVKAAQIDAFTANRKMSNEDLIQSIYNIIPLSKTMAKDISYLRGWASERARPAN